MEKANVLAASLGNHDLNAKQTRPIFSLTVIFIFALERTGRVGS
jgi:hypothetical protein